MIIVDDGALQAARDRGRAEAMTWRPIEEAPKDGTQILALLPTGRLVLVEWIETTLHPAGWWTSAAGYKVQPTHFTHCPPRAALAADGEERP